MASPTLNTEYSSRFSWPERAPTIRSTPDTVLAKPSRAAVRIFCTPSSSATLMAIALSVSSAVVRRFQIERSASAKVAMC